MYWTYSKTDRYIAETPTIDFYQLTGMSKIKKIWVIESLQIPN